MEQPSAAIERLHEDESLTADLDDASARTLLSWATEQLRAGQPEETVRQGLRALGKVVAGRKVLAPTDACAGLAEAGLAASAASLSALWAETGLRDEDWAARLLQSLSPTPAPAPAAGTSAPAAIPGQGGDPGGGSRVSSAPVLPQLQTLGAFSFEIVAEDAHSGARAGLLHTPHGDIPTPVYVPVGTSATVKTVSPDELRAVGATIILANTYHLYLRPGADVIAALGGLHRFMGWDLPLLTDSGGFQVFSLSANRKVAEEGVTFRSHIDGSTHLFTPESVVETEEKLGADIIMPLDECTPYPCSREYAEEALGRTHRWAERAQKAHTRADQALYGIVQGSTYTDLRQASAATLAAMGFPGYAIGGLSVGEPKEVMHAAIEACVSFLPPERPRHLLGVGSPEDFFAGVARGIDMFDCVLATRIARHGAFLVARGRLNIRNAQYERDAQPVEEGCTCYTCRTFSRAYLRHLFQSEELLGLRLATVHNLHFLLTLMRRIRESIIAGRFSSLKEEFLAGFATVPEEVRWAETSRRRRGRPH